MKKKEKFVYSLMLVVLTSFDKVEGNNNLTVEETTENFETEDQFTTFPNNFTQPQIEPTLPQLQDFNYYNLTSNQINESITDYYEYQLKGYDDVHGNWYSDQIDRQANQVRPTGTCNYVQTCKQTVTGRNQPYNKALRIIQNEEYLKATDTDIIRRNFEFSTSFDFKYNDNREYYVDRVLSRKKRAVQSPVAQFVASYQSLCSYYISVGSASFQIYVNTLINSLCLSVVYSPTADFPTITGISSCNFDATCIQSLTAANFVAVAAAGCSLHMTNLVSFMVPNYCASTSSTTSTTPAPQYAVSVINTIPIVQVAATALIGGAFMSISPMNHVSTQGVPQNSPQPGTPNGGGSPSQVSAASLAAISLVPLGLVPVAVFPPFATPRTLPAEAVIFAEDPNILDKDFVPGRFRRSLNTRRKYRAPSYFERALNKMGGLSSAFSITKRFRDLRREITCLRTRIDVYSKRFKASLKKQKSTNNYNYNSNYNGYTDYNYETQKRKKRAEYRKREFDIKDCFANYQEPLYGFRVRVTIVEDSPCILGSTCRGSPDDEDQITVNVDPIDQSLQNEPLDEYDRQTGEDFRSDAPPDCRVKCQSGRG